MSDVATLLFVHFNYNTVSEHVFIPEINPHCILSQKSKVKMYRLQCNNVKNYFMHKQREITKFLNSKVKMYRLQVASSTIIACIDKGK